MGKKIIKKILIREDKGEKGREVEVEVEIVPPGVCKGAFPSPVEEYIFQRTISLSDFYRKNKGGRK